MHIDSRKLYRADSASCLQTDPELAALSESPASSSENVFTDASNGTNTPNSSQQSLAAAGEVRKPRSRQSTVDGDTLRVPGGSMNKKNSWAARHDINGTIMREGDVGNGMHTIRPVKRFDSHNSNRQSVDYAKRRGSNGSLRSMLAQSSTPAHSPPLSQATSSSRDATMGRALVDEVIYPTLEKTVQHHELAPEEVETLSLIGNGFADLAEGNPELAYKVIIDILAGINE